VNGKNEDSAAVQTANMERASTETQNAESGDSKKDTRVSIHVHSIRKRLCDADGISAKAAIDGLVRGGILKDDSPKYVKEVTFSQEKGEEEKTIIEIEELEDGTNN